jgi:hypothetical protein
MVQMTATYDHFNRWDAHTSSVNGSTSTMSIMVLKIRIGSGIDMLSVNSESDESAEIDFFLKNTYFSLKI